jgi:hypothetical protein
MTGSNSDEYLDTMLESTMTWNRATWQGPGLFWALQPHVSRD